MCFDNLQMKNNKKNICISNHFVAAPCVLQDRDGAAGKEPVTLLTFSDHSDIVTLGDLKEDEHADVEEEVAANAEFYLGTSCSSQYAFTAAETGTTHSPIPMFSLANIFYCHSL